ncbi:MAG: hypothetical protein ACPGJS_00755 [Flammeovirgaceae bacterium]
MIDALPQLSLSQVSRETKKSDSPKVMVRGSKASAFGHAIGTTCLLETGYLCILKSSGECSLIPIHEILEIIVYQIHVS